MNATRPTFDDFVRHARRFGPELVLETAGDSLDMTDLARLDAELGRVNGRTRLPASVRHEAVKALRGRGLSTVLIARKLGVDVRTAQRLLREVPDRPKLGAQTRMGKGLETTEPANPTSDLRGPLVASQAA